MMVSVPTEKGKTMKWFRKHKQEIIFGVQSVIVLDTMIIGFWITYQSILHHVGVPLKWWSIVIAMTLAISSTIGTFAWIAKGNNNERKAD